jgi:hypothetical protein
LGKFIDLTGQRFGRLVALKRIINPEKYKKTFWLCKCDCGNEIIVWYGSLKNTKETQSCGCLNKEITSKKFTKKIEIGERFGKLIVLEYMGSRNHRAQWKCKCDCGNIKNISGKELRSGHSQSCGCSRIEDLTGMVFGKLTVEKISHTNSKGAFWLCKCDCGKSKTVSAKNLKKGDCKSCGCLTKEINAKIFRKEYGEARFNGLYLSYKRKATKRNLEFKLSKEEFKLITKMNCFYCGKEPHQISKAKESYGEYVYSGIDRIDSSKGYTADNVVPCCGTCNVAKLAMPREDFLSWVERVYNHSIKGEDMSNFNTEKYLEDAINKMLENETFRKQWELRDENQKEEFKIGLYKAIVIPMLKFKNNLSDK